MSEHAVSPEGREHSPWLGTIAPHQFQAALARFDLGAFVEATPVREGLYGQNVFVTGTKGKYVLRGRPIYPWQFPKECFAAALLHQRSQVPVAHPYLLDPSTDIFGWPYILMPRLSGVGGFDEHLTVGEQLWVARAIARNLARMQELTWAFAGEYDLASDTIQPFSGGYAQWFVDDTRRFLALCLDEGFITAEDVAWAERVIGETKSALAVDFRPCFVLGDYHPANVLVACDDGEWRVSGLFDLPGFYFGDGEPDLVRTIGVYLDAAKHADTRLARAFGTTYLEARSPRPGFVERYALSMLRDRLQVWELGKRRRLHFFIPEGQSFREYAERHVSSYRLFDSHIR